MRRIKQRQLAILGTVLFLCSETVSAANVISAPRETYKSTYVFIPGSPGTYGYWGYGASPEELWSQSSNVEFQYFGAIASVGTSVASAAASAVSAIGGVVSGAVAAAGGIAQVVAKAVPMVVGITKDVIMQQVAANDARSLSNAENKAAMARLIVETEATKAAEKLKAEAAIEVEKIRAEAEKEKTKQAEAEKEKARIEAESKAASEKKTEEKAASSEKKEEEKATSVEKKVDAEASKAKADEAKKKLQETVKKDIKADKDLKKDVDKLVDATQKAKETVATEVKKASPAAAMLYPQFEVSTRFTAETEGTPEVNKTATINAKKFQEEAVKEAKTEKLIGSVADKIHKESQVFQNAMNELVKGRTAGLEAKDLGPQIKAVDASWAKLQKLYGKTEDASKSYDEQINELDTLNVDDDAELDRLIDSEDADLDKLTEEQLDALLEKEIEDELNQLEAQLDELDKELAKMEAADNEQQ